MEDSGEKRRRGQGGTREGGLGGGGSKRTQTELKRSAAGQEDALIDRLTGCEKFRYMLAPTWYREKDRAEARARIPIWVTTSVRKDRSVVAR